MTESDIYSLPAELFIVATGRASQGGRYLRFPRASDAIRFAIEDLPAAALRGATLQVDEERYVGRDIRALHDAPEYPHTRGKQ